MTTTMTDRPPFTTTMLAPARQGRRTPAQRFTTLLATEVRVWLRDAVTAATALVFPVAFLLGIPSINSEMQQAFGADSGYLAGFTGVDLFLPAVLGMAMTSPAVLALPTTFATLREGGILRRMSVTPLRAQSVLGVHVLINLGATVVASALAVLAAHLVFGLNAPANLGVAIAAYAGGLVVMFSLSMLLAAVMKRASQANGIGMLLFFALIISSGFMTPMGMPDAMANVTRFTPLGAAVQAMQAGWFDSGIPVLQLVVMTAWTAVLVPTAIKIFRWS